MFLPAMAVLRVSLFRKGVPSAERSPPSKCEEKQSTGHPVTRQTPIGARILGK